VVVTTPFDASPPAALQSLVNDKGECATDSDEGSHQELKQSSAQVEGVPASAIKDVMIEAEVSFVTQASLAQSSGNRTPSTSQNGPDDEQSNFAPSGKRK
jgi:hypothetical protein